MSQLSESVASSAEYTPLPQDEHAYTGKAAASQDAAPAAGKRHIRVTDAAGVLFFIGGLVGLGLHTAYLHAQGTAVLYNLPWFLGVHLASATAFYGLQAVLYGACCDSRQRRESRAAHARVAGRASAYDSRSVTTVCCCAHPRVWRDMNAGYYTIALCISVVLSIGYWYGYRMDGGLWGLALTASVINNLYIAMDASVSFPSREQLKAIATLSPPSPLPSARAPAFASLNDTSSGTPLTSPSTATHPRSTARPASPFSLRTCIHHWRRPNSRTWCCLVGANVCARALALLLMAALLGGCWLQALGWHRFPPRGSFYTITYPDTTTQRIMAWCTGGGNASLPTIWLEIGGGGHSSSDLYGLQFELNDAGYRVCTYDFPGTAWSDYAVPDQPYMTDLLMDAMNEAGPFIMIGTMDSGPDRIHTYALQHPNKVLALVPISWGPPEFVSYQDYNGWDDNTARAYALSQIESRLALCDVIRGLAVQWGILQYLLPPSEYEPASMRDETRFLNDLNEKQWSSQCDVLAQQVASPDLLFDMDSWYTQRGLASHIPVFAFWNNISTPTPCDAACAFNAYAVAAAYNYSVMMAAATPAGGRVIVCQDCPNLLGQAPNIEWTAAQILGAIAGITVPTTA